MSASYTLHVSPDSRRGDPRALERATLVRDGFSPWAFLAPGLWFLVHRHWLLGLSAFVVVFGFGAGLRALGLHPGSVVLAELLLHVLFGLEGASLRRWAYARRGRPPVDVVFAASEADAEAKCFARWLEPDTTASRMALTRQAAPAIWGRPAEDGVIGLFPDLEGRAR